MKNYSSKYTQPALFIALTAFCAGVLYTFISHYNVAGIDTIYSYSCGDQYFRFVFVALCDSEYIMFPPSGVLTLYIILGFISLIVLHNFLWGKKKNWKTFQVLGITFGCWIILAVVLNAGIFKPHRPSYMGFVPFYSLYICIVFYTLRKGK